MATGRVLVVDDHDLDRKLSVLDLEEAGFAVSEAGDVTQALDVLSKKTFDVIVLDIRMPGTDGLTFLRGLKSGDKLASIPVVMLSASDEMEDELQAMSGGAVRYIVKPQHRDVLVQTVTSVLDQSRRSHPSSS